MTDKALTLAITGASGAPYALRLMECVLAAGWQLHLLISSAAKVVLATETPLRSRPSPRRPRLFDRAF